MALAAPLAHGMGLGQMQVKSGLNQPLVAEIPIISATQSELDKLDVRLAPPEAFARVGLDEPTDLTANLQFSVGKNAHGQPVIRITTSSRFREPILSFLVEANWGKGTVTREYTALIDPPYIAPAIVTPMPTPAIVSAPPPAPVVAPEVVPPPTAPAAAPAETMAAPEPPPPQVLPPPPEPEYVPPPPPAPEPIAAAPEPAPQPVAPTPAPPKPTPRVLPPAPVPAPTPVAAANGQYGPVAAGQTLWSIANSVRPDPDLSTNQMMLAILRSNPDAFDQDNINRLKSGSVLRIPDRDEVSRLSAEQAAALVHEQAAAWRTPRAPVPQPAEVANAESPKLKPAAHTEAPATVASENPAPVTRPAHVSKPRRTHLAIVPPAGKASARSVESGAAAGAGGTELRAQLTQAREDLAASKAESAELRSRVSDLEKQQGDRQRLIDLQSSQMKELQDRLRQLEAEKSTAAVAPAPVPAPAPATAPAAASTATTAAVPAPTPAVTAPAKPAEKPVPVSAPAQEEPEPAWYSNYYVIGAGVLALIAILVFALRRFTRKAENGDSPVRRISDDDALRASLATTRKKPTAGTDEVAAVGATAPPVDKEAQALAAAVRSRPQDLEAHLSQLRYFHSHGDAVGYESAAQAMRMQVASTTDPRWREAVVMGAALLPGHPLFSQAGWNQPRFNENEAAARTSETPAAADTKSAPAAAAPASASDKGVSVSEASDDEWDRAMAQPAPAAPAPAVTAPKPAPVIAAAPTPAPAPPVVAEEPDMSFSMPTDIHRGEAEVLAEDEASATRIELAKAYLDIGDLEGARSMLEEVMADGGPAAKSVAERILKEIG